MASHLLGKPSIQGTLKMCGKKEGKISGMIKIR